MIPVSLFVPVLALLAAGPVRAGDIVGKVRYAGTAPVPAKIQVTKDQAVCGKATHVDESLIVGADKGVMYVVVKVADPKDGKTMTPPKKPSLDQNGCKFVPHVEIVPAGQEIDIVNSDGILHNIHSFPKNNPPFNKAQPKFKKEMVEKLEKPELIKVQCDAHSWMLGWIYVTDNPAAVTDGNGAFKLENVPPGKHKVEVIHPVLGKQTKEVEVRVGQEVKVAFELKK
jgi:plastocyanin